MSRGEVGQDKYLTRLIRTPYAVALGRLRDKKGGKATARKPTIARRVEIAKKALGLGGEKAKGAPELVFTHR